uniref:Bestrophin homolog n=1 Tax=Plectus sambesii TaxID=2011161 RepID=A0A914UVJ9_9BILA
IDLYIPVLSVMQFIFYVGWLKVAQALLNPLGEDDDDFECDYMIDRNLQVGLCVVDDAQGKLPVLERDRFWDDKMATPLYTTECAERSINPLVGSCAQAEEDSKPEQPPGDIVMIKRRKISTSNPSLVQENDFEQAIGHKKRRMSTVSGASFLTSARSSFRRQSLRMSDFIKRKVLGLKSHRAATLKILKINVIFPASVPYTTDCCAN